MVDLDWMVNKQMTLQHCDAVPVDFNVPPAVDHHGKFLSFAIAARFDSKAVFGTQRPVWL